MFGKISNYALLQHLVPVGWKYQMLFRWFTVMAEQIKTLEKKDEDNRSFLFLPAEYWKWGRSDLSPKKRAPYTQYKYLAIRIEDESDVDNVTIVRVADLVNEDVRPPMGNMIDLDLSDVQYKRLTDILVEKMGFKDSNGREMSTLRSIIIRSQHT